MCGNSCWPKIPPPIPGRIAVVGVCGAGKTTLVEGLCALGYDARQCGQEHSYIPNMWQRISRPETLVFLDASLDTVKQRGVTMESRTYQEQGRRLGHARQHCHIYVDTDNLLPEEVLRKVLSALPQR